MAKSHIETFQKALLAHGDDLGTAGADGDFGPTTLKRGLARIGEPPVPEKQINLTPPTAIKLDERAETSLVGVHPDLVRVVRRAAELTGVDFTVTEGRRTLERQKQLVASGASKTLRSRHIPGGKLNVAHAVDLAAKVGGVIRWDWPLYVRLAEAMKKAAKDVGVPIEWGGDWTTFKDGPHFQLPWAIYPV